MHHYSSFFASGPFLVGAPIDVEKVKEPTQEQLDELHDTYVSALTQLFEENKEKYGIPKEARLTFV